MNTFRGAAVLVVTALLAVAAPFVSPASAQAADPYCQDDCIGEMPGDTNCRLNAYGMAAADLRDDDAPTRPTADLWYSPTCRTVWGEYTSSYEYDESYLQIWSQAEYGGMNKLEEVVGTSGKGTFITPMVAFRGKSVKFCSAGYIDWDPDAEGYSSGKPYVNCTRWR